MRGAEIRLNIYPLVEQEFEFHVWRKPYEGESKEGEFLQLYRNTLPINRDNLEEREEYWVSFKPKQGFEGFICKQNYNNVLTVHFLYSALYEKTEGSLSEREFLLPKRGFRKGIFYVLREHNEGKEAIWVEPYFLRKKGKFGFLVDYRFCKKEDVNFSARIQQLSLSLDKEFRSNRNFYIDKYHKLNEFRNLLNGKIFPILIDNLVLDIDENLEVLPRETLGMKKYVFANGREDSSQFKGLISNGPLKAIKDAVRIVYVYRGKDEVWLNDLTDALAGKAYDVNFDGIEKMFGLETHEEQIRVLDYSVENRNNIVNKVIEVKRNNSNALVIPVIALDKIDSETYYDFKYRFLKENLALQAVTLDLIKKRSGLKWSASNIALQMFAKLGGQPWMVRPSNENCIVFGIGQSHLRKDGQICKYFAYSVSTDSSGLYKRINTLGKAEIESVYLEQLKINMLNDLKMFLGEGYKKCVLHVPFKVRMKELNAINEAIIEVAGQGENDKIDFVVLKVNTDNHFFGYADTNSLVPYESSYITLADKEYLVWFEGLQFHRESIFKRCAGPVHIQFYWTNRPLEEMEKRAYLQDVLNLSGANWRGFNAKNLPVSIYYCELVSNFLARFPEEIENIEEIKYTWFL